MEKTKQERQAYIEAIESGRYKTGTVANTKILAVIAIVFGIILTINTILSLLQDNGALLLLLFVSLATALFPIVLVAIIMNTTKGAPLDKLTPSQRDLILNGEIIEADLEAVEQNGSLFIFRCSANYAGDTWRFSSPAIRVQPIPSEDRKIPVYINPQDPNQFFVDIGVPRVHTCPCALASGVTGGQVCVQRGPLLPTTPPDLWCPPRAPPPLPAWTDGQTHLRTGSAAAGAGGRGSSRSRGSS